MTSVVKNESKINNNNDDTNDIIKKPETKNDNNDNNETKEEPASDVVDEITSDNNDSSTYLLEYDMDNIEYRTVIKDFKAHSQKEGAGFTVHRPIGGWHMDEYASDPFLMLDELGPKNYDKGEFEGAPWHPHRGFDTVMYSKEGYGTHQDSMGNKGTLGPGDVQWMTAGSGIIHDEGKDHPGGLLHGFQMWCNLPKTHKMCDPQYQQISAKNFPFLSIANGVKCKVISGEILYKNKDNKYVKQISPLKPIQPIMYMDYNIAKNTKYTHIIPKKYSKIFETVIIYCYNGVGYIKNGKKYSKMVRTSTIKLSKNGNGIEFKTDNNNEFGFLLLMGKPINEPIAWHGPFVMNTQKEIIQAMKDYQNGTLVKKKGKTIIY